MGWLLAGCCALALIGLSEALSVTQIPRFYGVQTNRNVGIFCILRPNLPATVGWFKAHVYDEDPKDRVKVEGERIGFKHRDHTLNFLLNITNVHVEDSAVYFCKVNNTWGPGTQLIVLKATDLSMAKYRTMLKDALIFIQGLLLAAAVTAILLRGRIVRTDTGDPGHFELMNNFSHYSNVQSEKTEIIYEEPETDHIYEGLAIERCDGGLYEELSVYAQADDAEAPWE